MPFNVVYERQIWKRKYRNVDLLTRYRIAHLFLEVIRNFSRRVWWKFEFIFYLCIISLCTS